MDNEELKENEEQNTWICDCCGEVINSDDDEGYITNDGDHICESCYEDDYFTCEDCGEIFENDLMTEDSHGNYICEDCRDDHYFYCDCCHEYYDSNAHDSFEVDGEILCYECYIGEAAQCCICGDEHLTENMDWDEGNEGYICGYCHRNRRKAIHSYGYKPAPKFKTSSHDVFETDDDIKDFVMGVELEVDNGESPEDTAAQICEASEDVYCKHDGSLNDGIEIVTHPCTLEYHMNGLGWDKIIKISLENGFRSHDAKTCGLHVHVGRKGFGKTREEQNKAIAKVMYTMDRFWSYIEIFTRRKGDHLERWAARPELPSSIKFRSEKSLINSAMATEDNGRYQAVNLQNRATIEFRLFNGTLKYNTLIATLEFVHNICSFAKEKTFEEVFKSQWEDIVQYKKYDELNTYLAERGLDNVNDIPEIEWTNTIASPLLAKKPMGVGSFVIQRPYEIRGTGNYRRELAGYVGIIIKDDPDSYNRFLVSFGREFPEDNDDFAPILHDDHGRRKISCYRYYKEEELMLATDARINGIDIRRLPDEHDYAIGDIVRLRDGVLKGRLGRIAALPKEEEAGVDDMYTVILDGLRVGSCVRNNTRSSILAGTWNLEHSFADFKYGDLVSYHYNSLNNGCIGIIRAIGNRGYSAWEYGINVISGLEESANNLAGILKDYNGLNADSWMLEYQFRDEFDCIPEESNLNRPFVVGEECLVNIRGTWIVGEVKENVDYRSYIVDFGANRELIVPYFEEKNIGKFMIPMYQMKRFGEVEGTIRPYAGPISAQASEDVINTVNNALRDAFQTEYDWTGTRVMRVDRPNRIPIDPFENEPDEEATVIDPDRIRTALGNLV